MELIYSVDAHGRGVLDAAKLFAKEFWPAERKVENFSALAISETFSGKPAATFSVKNGRNTYCVSYEKEIPGKQAARWLIHRC